MRFSAAAVLAFVAASMAQTPDFDPIYTPKKDELVTAGSSINVTWDAPAKYASGNISIELIGGATQNTQTHIADIASGVKNDAKIYTWTIDASLGAEKVYGLVFKLEKDPKIFQYSNPFHIKAVDDKTKAHGVFMTVPLSSTAPVSTTASLPASSFSTAVKTQHSNSTVSCTSKATGTDSQHAPTSITAASSAPTSAPTAITTAPTGAPAPSGVVPTASNPVMNGTSAAHPVPTNAASSMQSASFGILAVVAAFFVL